jgi:hypothetical protein
LQGSCTLPHAAPYWKVPRNSFPVSESIGLRQLCPSIGSSELTITEKRKVLASFNMKKACNMLCGKGQVRTQNLGYQAERYDNCAASQVVNDDHVPVLSVVGLEDVLWQTKQLSIAYNAAYSTANLNFSLKHLSKQNDKSFIHFCSRIREIFRPAL